MADFALPRVPDGMEGNFLLMPEQSKENSEKRKAWFREQADLEARNRVEKRRRETERETARQLALQEQDLLNDLMVEARQQHGKQKISNGKKRSQPEATASAATGAEKAVVLPDKSPPPPSALSKAWSSLKKGTGRMRLSRKSTFDLRDMAEKMAPPPPPLSQRGDSNNTIDDSEDSDDSGLRAPAPSSHGQVRYLTEPVQKDKKLNQQEMWDLLSIRPPKRRPSELAPLFIPVPGQGGSLSTTKGGVREHLHRNMGPVSPPPMSPLPPLPPSRAASRSIEVNYNVEDHSIDTVVASLNCHLRHISKLYTSTTTATAQRVPD
ncbi:hypothetical protein SBRCBS47491_005984 [Sporothrix bragantina]|uniref:Uncharacterized protein n=1 Tax=Sporothrix bragantina TaxID=671064 RepID=A0ABP0C125_9PEZI